jgi:ureidoglycolate lyase
MVEDLVGVAHVSSAEDGPSEELTGDAARRVIVLPCASMQELRAQRISIEAYAPYGALVAAGDVERGRDANYGTAIAWDALATIDNTRGERARATASLFRCLPHHGESVPIVRLERHAHSTQMFVPMCAPPSAARYLVIVARGEDRPDLATLTAFLVTGPRAITYAPGTWHHPIVALESAIDFVNLVCLDGTQGDCEEVPLATPVTLVLP